MSFFRHIVGFFRAFKRSDGATRTSHDGHSLARALRDSTHVRGSRGGMPRAGTERQHKIVAEGHKRYRDSFEKR